jgi:competence protein ComEA
LHAYFDYSNNERKGFFTLLGLSLILFLMPYIYTLFFAQLVNNEPISSNQSAQFVAQLQEAEQQYKNNYTSNYKNNTNPNQQGNNYPNSYNGDFDKSNYNKKDTVPLPKNEFLFNPNNATEADFLKLGLNGKTANSIINYREKGGKFKIKADFAKIYTLSEIDYNRLYNFIDLPTDAGNNFANNNPNPNAPNGGFAAPKKSKTVILDINTAQAADFQQLYGIGTGYANRIIKYREDLGGFISVSQIAEVYGMPDSTFQNIKPNLTCPNPKPKLININTVKPEEFKHPYLSFSQAKAIMKYREQQGGAIKNLDYLQILMELNDQQKTAIRIKPYLSLN